MNSKKKILDLFTILVIAVFPHLELMPFFSYSIPIILLVLLALKYRKETLVDIGFSLRRFELKAIPIGIGVALLTLAFMQLIFFPVLENFVTFKEEDVALYDAIRESKAQYLLLVVMGWVIGGLYEEIVFHGFIFTRLEKIFGGKYATKLSFLVTALIFGGYHFQLGAAGLINATLVGAVYLALFLYFKRNLWYSIICHGVYNTAVMTLIYLGYL